MRPHGAPSSPPPPCCITCPTRISGIKSLTLCLRPQQLFHHPESMRMDGYGPGLREASIGLPIQWSNSSASPAQKRSGIRPLPFVATRLSSLGCFPVLLPRCLRRVVASAACLGPLR